MSTAALVYDCGWLKPEWGFARGFQEYQVKRWRVSRQARHVLSWIDEHREEPFFFFFHTFEPHSDFNALPYEAPGVSRRLVHELFAVPNYGCRRGRCASMLIKGINGGSVPIKSYDRLVLRYLYDRGVQYTDLVLGELFDVLRGSGLWNNLVVVVTSDHGEAFLEHGSFGHTTLHEEVIRVPLLVKWPNGARAGYRNDQPSTSIDLGPTLVELARLDAGDLPGTHLHQVDPQRTIFSGDYAKVVVKDGIKGVFGGPDGLDEMYNLALDPDERDNLVRRRHVRRGELVKLIDRQVRSDRERYLPNGPTQDAEPETELTREEEERLRALGYID